MSTTLPEYIVGHVSTFLAPKGSASCLNIQRRKTLDVSINYNTEEIAQQVRSISARMFAKNTFLMV